jgi:tetratricopeptide (TPR) repeat protein
MRSSIALALLALALPAGAGAAAPAEVRRRALEHYKTGQAALTSERFEQAVEEFHKAIALDPLLVMAHYGLGQSHMALKDYPTAVRAYLGCRKAFEELEARRLMNDVEWERQLDEQIQALEDRILALSSGHVQTGSLGGNTTSSTIQRLQDQQETLRSQRRRSQTQAEPTPAWILVALGSAHFRSGDMAEAERQYKAALALDPKIGEVHNNLAVVYLLTGRIDEAQREVELATSAGFVVPPGLVRDIQRRKAEPRKP